MSVARRSSGRLLTVFIVLCVAALPSAAIAATTKVIDVFPGPHAIADALAKARPGDVLSIHTGTYTGGVTIKVRSVTLQPAGDGPVTLDGQCTANSTIEVKANDVTLLGPDVTVQGGGFFEVDVKTFTGAHISGLTVVESGCDAEYGINIFQTGSVVVEHNVASGFGDSGIYVGGITGTGGQILVMHNEVFDSSSGIILENSTGVYEEILIGPNNLHDNAMAGVSVTNTGGANILRNTTRRDGTYGIVLDAESDSNKVRGNIAKRNEFDLANLGGTGNCFKHNRYVTSEGDISC